jgi:hypothetical protein
VSVVNLEKKNFNNAGAAREEPCGEIAEHDA